MLLGPWLLLVALEVLLVLGDRRALLCHVRCLALLGSPVLRTNDGFVCLAGRLFVLVGWPRLLLLLLLFAFCSFAVFLAFPPTFPPQSVSDAYIRTERKTCCATNFSSIFIDWTYDVQASRRCMCCCTRCCEHGMITAATFDNETPQLSIRVKGDPTPLFSAISQRIDVRQASKDHFLRSRTQKILDAAFKLRENAADGAGAGGGGNEQGK